MVSSTFWIPFAHTTGNSTIWSNIHPEVFRISITAGVSPPLCKDSLGIFFFCFHSVEKDGSPLSDEKQTIQTSLFSLLKDLLKSPTQEELHSVLSYILAVGEEGQVELGDFSPVLNSSFLCDRSHDVMLSTSDGEGLGCAV